MEFLKRHNYQLLVTVLNGFKTTLTLARFYAAFPPLYKGTIEVALRAELGELKLKM